MQTVSVSAPICSEIAEMQHVAATAFDDELQLRKAGRATRVFVIQVYQRRLRALPAINERWMSRLSGERSDN